MLAALLGCEAAIQKATSVPTVSRPPASEATTSARPWQRVFYPSVPTEARLVETTPEGVERVLVGGFRVELGAGGGRISESAPLEALRATCHSGEAWLHVTERGVVYSSRSFLGELSRVGVLGANARLLQCGPELVVEGSPPVRWTLGGPRPLRAALPLGLVRFSQAGEGEALAFPDLGFVTHDGGKAFEAAARPIAVLDVVESLPKPLVTLDEPRFARALALWLRRAVSSDAGRAVGGERLRDGTWLRSASTPGRMLVALRAPSGVVTSLEVHGQACELVPFGARVLASCHRPSELGLISIYPEQKTLWSGEPHFSFVGDDVGRFVFAVGQGGALNRFDGSTWLPYPSLTAQPVLAKHGWLLLSDHKLVATEHPERAAPQLLAEGEQILGEVSLLPHGVSFMRDSGGNVELVELELPSARLLRQLPLEPIPVHYGAAFADPEHGVGWNNDVGLTWSAARARFEPLPSPEVGRHEPQELPRCTPEACRLDALQALAPAALDSQVLLPDPPRRVDLVEWAATPPEGLSTHQTGFERASYTCQARESEIPALVGFAAGADEIFGVTSAGGMLDLPHGDGEEALGWHGSDGRGSFRTSPRITPELSELRERLPARAADSDLLPVLVARHYVLLDDQNGGESDFAGRKLLRLREDGLVASLFPEAFASLEVVPLPQGGALGRTVYDRHQLLFVLDAWGAVVEQRAVTLTGQERDFLALWQNRAGLVILDEGAESFVSLTPRSTPQPLLLPRSKTVTECRGPTPPDAATIFAFDEPDLAWETAFFGGAGHPTSFGELELTSKAACLRRVVVAAPVSARLAPQTRVLRGPALGRRASSELVCRPEANP
jgi:hypothetical protein